MSILCPLRLNVCNTITLLWQINVMSVDVRTGILWGRNNKNVLHNQVSVTYAIWWGGESQIKTKPVCIAHQDACLGECY